MTNSPVTATSTTAEVANEAPTTAKSTAAAVAAKTPSASAESNQVFLSVLARAVNRLAGWPGPAHNFVSITNHLTDQTLDAADDQLDNIYATAPVGSPARWLPDLIGITHLFFKSEIPNYTISDTFNAWGDFLNRIMPPFKIAAGADTAGVITRYKVMGAAVVGTATVLSDMLNGVYDPAQWEIDVIKTTTGADVTRADLTDFNSLSTKVIAAQAGATLTGGLTDGGAFYDPTRAWNLTLPTWTADQVNPFTVVLYVATVAMYKRFQEMAALQTYTRSTTYESWLYTLGLTPETSSEYAAGSFHAIDQDGNTVSFQPADGNTYTSAWGALVTINTYDGGYTYTNTLPGAAYFAAGAAGQYDTVNIPVTSADGAPYTLTFQVKILTVDNTPLPGTSFTTSTTYNSGYPSKVLGSAYAYGSFHAVDQNGNAASFSPAAGNTYTSAWGALVTINSSSGGFSYTQTLPGAAYFHAGTSSSPYDTVDVTVKGADGQNYLVTVKVQIPGGTNSAPSWTPSLGAATGLGIRRSTVAASDSDGDPLTYSLVNPGTTGATSSSIYTTNGSIVQLNTSTGAITYIPKEGVASDSFQVQVADDHGGVTPVTVTVNNTVTRTLTYSSPNPSSGVIVGGLSISDSSDIGLLKYSVGTQPTNGTVAVAEDGSYTYTRTGPGADTFTIIGTDINGKSTLIKTAAIPAGPILSLTKNPFDVAKYVSGVDTSSGATGEFSLDTSTWKQTTTGQLSATVANGLTVVWPSYATTANGGQVTINPDGTFKYTITKDQAYFHARAKIGVGTTFVAGGTTYQTQDYFLYAAYDSLGGQSNVMTVYLPVAGYNNAPTITGIGTSFTCAAWTCGKQLMTVSDPDGDSIPNTRITPGTGAGWTTTSGQVDVWGSGTTAVSWPNNGGVSESTKKATNRFTVYDGCYSVKNGYVTSTVSSFWANWDASGAVTSGST
ncbi:hypothetical protein BOH72_08580 [Mycobacterium sp. WY10]|nr:hypothetical protein BOH72_08580 [Mycobacterium sp. WY10]